MKPIGRNAALPGCVCLGLTLIAVLAHAQLVQSSILAGAEAGAALRPSAYVDEREMARLENGHPLAVKLAPGKHRVRSHDKASRLDLDIKAGADYYVRVDMQTGFWKGHSRFNSVPPEQGAYEIKQIRALNPEEVGLVVSGSQP